MSNFNINDEYLKSIDEYAEKCALNKITDTHIIIDSILEDSTENTSDNTDFFNEVVECGEIFVTKYGDKFAALV